MTTREATALPTEPARTSAPYRAVLFDFGGTLDGDGVHWSTRFHEAYARAGVAVARERFDQAFVAADQKLVGLPDADQGGLKDLLARQVRYQLESLGEPDSRAADVVADVYATAAADLARSEALLRALRPYFRLGVVSNFTGALDRVLAEAGLLRLLNVVVDSAKVGVSKPDPEIFRLACRRLALAPEDCLLVGDSFDRDIAPAKEAGLGTAWLRGPGGRPCPDPARADLVVDSLKDLPARLGVHV
jgi:putative hydrolase of the HAD superfamily